MKKILLVLNLMLLSLPALAVTLISTDNIEGIKITKSAHTLNIAASAFNYLQDHCYDNYDMGYISDYGTDSYKCTGQVMIPLEASTEITSIITTVEVDDDDSLVIVLYSVNLDDGTTDMTGLLSIQDATKGVVNKVVDIDSGITLESNKAYFIKFQLSGTSGGASPSFYGLSIRYN